MVRFKVQLTTWPLGRTTPLCFLSADKPPQLRDVKIPAVWVREQKRLGVCQITVAILQESGRDYRVIDSEVREL